MLWIEIGFFFTFLMRRSWSKLINLHRQSFVRGGSKMMKVTQPFSQLHVSAKISTYHPLKVKLGKEQRPVPITGS